MTWKDCVAALQAGAEPDALLPLGLEESSRGLNPPPVSETSSLYQRLHDADDGERTFQLVYLRPPASFWEDGHACELPSERTRAAQIYDELELTLDLADAFRFLLVDPPEFNADSESYVPASACNEEPREEATRKTTHESAQNSSGEAGCDLTPARNWAFNLEDALEAVRELATPSVPTECATSAREICASLSVYEWSLVSQTLRERGQLILESDAALIRVAETVGSGAIGEWILLGLSKTARGAFEWLGEAEREAAASESLRLANTASQCIQSWSWASLKRQLKPSRACGEDSEAVLSSFALCKTLQNP